MPFRYAGGDLHEAADLAGLSVEALVAWHTTGRRTCRFIGFTPGFGYLTADEPGPVIPRRSRSRSRIPAGSVALADRYSAVYPRDSPGGWQLIGTTDAACGTSTDPSPPCSDRAHRGAVGRGAMTLEVLETGPLTTVQDLGRPGWFHAGVGVSGAADQTSHRLANRLVGNAAGAATLGCLLGGAVLRAQRAVAITVTGAAVEVLVDGRPVGRDAVVGLRAGQELSLRYASAGLRAYLAVRGGIDVPPVLGSRSYDTLARLGPAPLAPGDLLPVGTLSEALPLVDQAPTAPLPAGTLHVRVTPGPHPAGSAAWKVSTTSPAARGPSRRRPTAWGCG